MRVILTAIPFLVLVGCANVQGKLDDLSWGNAFDADFDETVTRARKATLRHFPRGFDPDKTNEEAGDFWTIWDHDPSIWYRETTRKKAHVKVERAGEGKVRVGVSVVQQLNENIDNPHDVGEDARWVKTEHDPETADLIQRAIARGYLDATPSEYWENKHRDPGKKKAMRQDLLDRAKDVDLDDEDKEFPALEKDGKK